MTSFNSKFLDSEFYRLVLVRYEFEYLTICCTCAVCRKWKLVASDNTLWSNLFKERWGEDHAAFYAPVGSKSWKDVYEVQDRCDRIGL